MKRFKRIYLPLLCLAVLFVALFGLSSCGDGDCKHNYEVGSTVDAGCTTRGAVAYSCTKCGEIKTELTDPIGHKFTNYVDDNNATCEAEGTKTAVCDNGCGATDTLPTPKTHVYGELSSNQDGHFHVCEVCGTPDKTEAHTPDASGNTCTACGYILHVHNPIEMQTKPATCTDDGYKAHWHCDVCDKNFTTKDCTAEAGDVVIKALGHDPRHIEYKAPTCTAQGNEECWYCDTCDKYFSDKACETPLSDADRILGVTKHSYDSAWVADSANHWHKCSCGAIDESTKAAHTPGAAATETTDQVCTVCNYIITPALNHTHSGTRVAPKDATCTEDGNKEHWTCSCGKLFSDAECKLIVSEADVTLERLGHIEAHKTAKDPTCTEDGYQEHWYCERCEKHFSDKFLKYEIDYNTIVRRAKHTAVVWTGAVDATCADGGNIAYWHCETCDKYYSDSALTKETTLEGTKTQALGHSPVHVPGKAATCTEKGSKEYWKCTKCNKNYTSVECTTIFNLADITIDAKGHETSEIVRVVPPTCTEQGYTIFKCKNCALTKNDAYVAATGHTDTESSRVQGDCQEQGYIIYVCEDGCEGYSRKEYIGFGDHDYEENTVDPTCIENGYTKHTCKECGYSYKDNEVAATGSHTFNKATGTDAYLAPTCTQAGYQKYKCDNCDESYTESLKALGHTHATPATCEAPSSACTRDECGYVAPAKGHSLSVESIEYPTCTEDGYINWECTNDGCGKTVKEVPEEYAATGHTAADNAEWTETEVAVIGADCTFVMKRTAPCQSCDGTVVKEGEEYVRHTLQTTITRTPTCEENSGERTTVCTKCDLEPEVVYYSDPTAHAWDGGALQPDNVTTLFTCSLCGGTKTSVSAKGETSTTVNSSAIQDSDDIELENATFVPSDDVKNNLSGDVTLGADKLDDKSGLGLSSEELERIGENPVYDFSLKINGEPQTSLGGEMTVRIPYTLGQNEDPDDIVVWYIKDNGEVVEQAAVYVVENGQGYAEFKTTHFSYYTVTKMTPAERCNMYGHNEKMFAVPATCLTEGYDMYICTRCGETRVDEYSVTPALDHNFVLDENTAVELSCTQDGYGKYACDRCGVSYEQRTKSTGHTWVRNIQNSTEATCYSTGLGIYSCSCGAEKTEEIPLLKHAISRTVKNASCTEDGYILEQCTNENCGYEHFYNRTPALGHSIVSTVVAPTCNTNGYTSHSCQRCDKEFEDTDIVKTRGEHVWNIEQTECTTDKICVNCGTFDKDAVNGGKATGHKFSAEGVCVNEGCKDKCQHNYVLALKDVAATCTKRLHDVEQCTVCGGTRDVNFEGELLPHSMKDGVCTGCGITSGTYYLSMLKTWENIDGFALKLTDLTVDVLELTEDASDWYKVITAAQADISELMIYTDANGELAGAAHGKISLSYKLFTTRIETYELKAVIENGNIYVEMISAVGDKGAVTTQHAVVKTESLLAMMMAERTGFAVEGLEAVIGWAIEYLPSIIKDYANNNESEINLLLGDLVNMFFTETYIDGGFAYVFDFDKLAEINKNLWELTIAEFIDLYFGENTFEELVTKLETAFGTKAPEIPELLTELGLDNKAVFEAVNAYMAIKNPEAEEPFDAETLINSEDYADVTLGMILTKMSKEESEKYITDMADTLRAASVYDFIGVFKEIEDTTELYASATKKIDELKKNFKFSYETNEAGAITLIKLYMKSLEMQVEEGTKFDIEIGLEFTPSGRINVNFDSIITEINKVTTFPDMGTEVEFGGYELDTLKTESTYTLGGVEYAIMGSADMTVFKNTVDYKEPITVSILEKCGDSYLASVVYLASSLKANFEFYQLTSDGASMFMLLVNPKTDEKVILTQTASAGESYDFIVAYESGESKKISISLDDILHMGTEEMFSYISYQAASESWYETTSTDYFSTSDGVMFYDGETGEFFLGNHSDFGDLHEFELDESKSVITDECEAVNYYHYVCKHCGEATAEYDVNYHEKDYRYELSEGSASCVDGIYEIEYCANCGEVFSSVKIAVEDHAGFYNFNFYKETNTLKYEFACICGEVKSSELYQKLNTAIDIDLVENDRIGGYSYVFTAEETATYQFWAEESFDEKNHFFVNVYDANGKMLSPISENSYDGGMSGGTGEYKPEYDANGKYEKADYKEDFGVVVMKQGNSAYELTAGETYYFVVDNISADIPLNIDIRRSESVALDKYGCTCGASMTLTGIYDKKQAELPEHADNCPLITLLRTNEHRVDEHCNVYLTDVIYFGTDETEEPEELELFRQYTGETRHETTYKSKYTVKDVLDEKGRLMTVRTEVTEEQCRTCKKVVNRAENIFTYDKATNTIYGEEHTYYYWSVKYSEARLASKQGRYLDLINFTHFDAEMLDVYSFNYSYNEDGSERHGEYTKYSYDVDNPCIVTETSWILGGVESTYTHANHHEAEKLVPDESWERTSVDPVYGNLTTKRDTYETYCTICYASLSKRANEITLNEESTYKKEIEERYESYAISADVYGYRLAEKYISEYEYLVIDGEYYEIVLLEERHYYKDGEEHFEKYEYTYPNSYCEYVLTWTTSDSEEVWTQTNTYHIATRTQYVLSDGSVICTDGLDLYEVCEACGYRELTKSGIGDGHPTRQGEVAEYDLTAFGSVCGGTFTVYSCPCGAERSSELDTSECDMVEQDHNYHEDETGCYYWTYDYGCAVTDPNPCGFTYTYITGVKRGANCLRVDYQTYIFGEGENSFTITLDHYSNNEYFHYRVSENIPEEIYEEDGYTVIKTGHRNYCRLCGQYTSLYERKDYFLNDESVRYTTTQTYFYANGNTESVEYYELKLFTTADRSYSEFFETAYRYEAYYEDGEMRVWSETRRDRESACPNAYIAYYTNSSNESWTETFEHSYWDLDHVGYDPYPTCSQFGVEIRKCRWCADEFEFTASPNDHSFYQDESGMHKCSDCGLESEVGQNGSITLEDLTAKYGDGSNIIIGFYNKDNINIMISFAVVLEGGELLDIDYSIEPEDNLVIIPVAELEEALMALGDYSICKNNVRIAFVPVGGSAFDYAITLDPHILTVSSSLDGETLEAEGRYTATHTYTCSVCREVIVSEDCSFSWLDGREDIIDGQWHRYEEYICSCGHRYKTDWSFTVENCTRYDYTDYYTFVGGEYQFVTRVQGERYNGYHSFVYKLGSIDDEHNIKHTAYCTDCGYSETQYCSIVNTRYEEIEGVTYIEHECQDCGYKYQERRYTVKEGCEITDYSDYYEYSFASGTYEFKFSYSPYMYDTHNIVSYTYDGIRDDGICYHYGYCDICGETKSFDCNNNYIGSGESEFDGSVRYYEEFECTTCGHHYKRVGRYETVGCTNSEYYDYYVLVDGEYVLEKSVLNYSSTSHNISEQTATEGDGAVIFTPACSSCGFQESSITAEIVLSDGMTYSYEKYESYVYLAVEITEAANYAFYSETTEDSTDPYGAICDAEFTQIADCDDNNGDLNFYTEAYLEAGTYYLAFSVYPNSTSTSFKICFSKI